MDLKAKLDEVNFKHQSKFLLKIELQGQKGSQKLEQENKDHKEKYLFMTLKHHSPRKENLNFAEGESQARRHYREADGADSRARPEGVAGAEVPEADKGAWSLLWRALREAEQVERDGSEVAAHC